MKPTVKVKRKDVWLGDRTVQYRVKYEYCGKCGKFVTEYFNYCAYCGEPIERERKDEKKSIKETDK